MVKFTWNVIYNNCSNVFAEGAEWEQKNGNVLQSRYQVGFQG